MYINLLYYIIYFICVLSNHDYYMHLIYYFYNVDGVSRKETQ